ncbi:MAG: hypothetical protein WC912_07875, partial [Thermovirgaceae bacterium]
QGYSEDWTTGRVYMTAPIEKILENQVKALPGLKLASDGLKPCISSHPNLQIDITCHRGLKGL